MIINKYIGTAGAPKKSSSCGSAATTVCGWLHRWRSQKVRASWSLLIGDAASCTVREQVTPSGYYNPERMLKFLVGKRAKIGVCGSCVDARGIKSETLVEGTQRSSMDELTAWIQAADKILVC